MADEREQRLVAALRDLAATVSDRVEPPQVEWRRDAEAVFTAAGLDLTDEQFERGWRTLWQSAFMGGNYTMDARRILRAIDGGTS